MMPRSDFLYAAAFAVGFLLAGNCTAAPGGRTQPAFMVSGQTFLYDGKPFQIRSGEMHFARIPRDYWRQRLELAKAMGLNTVCAYLFWNQHEPRPGDFDFSGNADAGSFVRMAKETGLKVILRPGPYSCAEWDFGGMPPWLLAIPDIRLRCSDARFVAAARRYLLRVGKELAPLQATRGGPIILVQVENEYGSYGDDKAYLAAIRDALRDAGFDVPLFTCDGPEALARGSVAGAIPVANFGSSPGENLAALRRFSPGTPAACGEYYPGWFDHWGEEHHTREARAIMPDIEELLNTAAGFSIYMFQGGTSFGFCAGANARPDGRYEPVVTSYDYDAPLDEAGRPTPKYFALRALFAKHQPAGEALPEVPTAEPAAPVPPILFTESASLFDNLPDPIADIQPRPMEAYGQSQGLILYRSSLDPGNRAPLTVRELHDYGLIFVGGRLLGTLDRRAGEKRIEIPARDSRVPLDILVEAMGRVNYGPFMIDRKGITERVEFPVPYPAGVVMNWQVYPLPLDGAYLAGLRYLPAARAGPAFHRGRFLIRSPSDTFLDLRGWNKGMVWVNGHNLGRFWRVGPQQTLYLPGCWLRRGENEIVLFDFESAVRAPVPGLAEPVLNEVRVPPVAGKFQASMSGKGS